MVFPPQGGAVGGAPTDAPFAVVSLDPDLSDERRLVGGNNVSLVDGGANGDLTIDLDDPLLISGPVGAPSIALAVQLTTGLSGSISEFNIGVSGIVFVSVRSVFTLLSSPLLLQDAATTRDRGLTFDAANEDFIVGDGTAAQRIHMAVWKTWTIVFGGFSADPVPTAERYTQVGKLVTAHIAMGNGTSDATTFTITLPIAAANTVVQDIPIAVVVDNGTTQTTMGLLRTRVNSITADLFLDPSQAVWTASGNKKADLVFSYESI